MPTPNDFVRLDFQLNSNVSGGEFAQQASSPEAPTPAPGNYPNIRNYGFDPLNTEFSAKPQFATEAESVPEILDRETGQSMSDFANLQRFLMNNLETAGSRVAHDQRNEWTPQSGAEGDFTPWP